MAKIRVYPTRLARRYNPSARHTIVYRKSQAQVYISLLYSTLGLKFPRAAMARTGLKKVKNVSGSTASNAKKTQSSSGAAQRATGKRHTGPQQQPKQIATHQHQQQKRQTRQNPSTSSPMLRSKGRAEGARDDIDKAFNNLRGSNDDGSALKVKQEVSCTGTTLLYLTSHAAPILITFLSLCRSNV